MHFSRLLSEREARASQGKVRLLFGPRQTGKTMPSFDWDGFVGTPSTTSSP